MLPSILLPSFRQPMVLIFFFLTTTWPFVPSWFHVQFDHTKFYHLQDFKFLSFTLITISPFPFLSFSAWLLISQYSTTPLTLSSFLSISSPSLLCEPWKSYTCMSTSSPLLEISYIYVKPKALPYILSVKLVKFSWSQDPINLYSTLLILNLFI